MLVLSWNINSVRHRLRQLRRVLRKYQPDVVCLQETKVVDELFPEEAFTSLDYTHIAHRGQKGYHGVAIASRVPLAAVHHKTIARRVEARHICATVQGIQIHNIYFPAGGDDPNPDRNDKFAAKLAYFRAAARWMQRWPKGERLLVGDFNIAPLETDVWSHKKLRRAVTHTPIEIDHLEQLQRSQNWVDVARAFVPPEEKLFTWWSYRNPNHRRPNRGRRLDHIWATPSVALQVLEFGVAEEVRAWKSPSDHAPLWCRIAA